jgi:hypothetical protein
VVFSVVAALTVLAFKRLPSGYSAYKLAMIVLILTRHDQLGRPLLSFSLHALMLFPGFIALAATVRSLPRHVAIAYGSGAIKVLLLTVFFMWGFSE